MVRSNGHRLLVSVNDLRRKIPRRAAALLSEAQLELLAFQRALREYVLSIDDRFGKSFEEFHIGFEGRCVFIPFFMIICIIPVYIIIFHSAVLVQSI